ncbi:lipid scramblase CLPTM1L-like [Liolophura sinensis]|uniref:lipid scramblase CLPTM1L-like n=1 Tax=Liolophura sinensis TaxID=3198878 RepID=UPI0031584894
MKPSFTLIISGLFAAYLTHSIWTMYTLFHPSQCTSPKPCLQPFIASKPALKMHVYTSQTKNIREGKLNLVWQYDNFSIAVPETRTFNVSIPVKTRQNGTLFAHVFVFPRGENPLSSVHRSYQSSALTTYTYPRSQTFNLLTEDQSAVNVTEPVKMRPVTHWRQKLAISVLDEEVSIDQTAIPGEIYPLLSMSRDGSYLPVLYIDVLSNRVRDLTPVNKTSQKLPLEISYTPISFGKLRLWRNMEESIKILQSLGFSEKDTDEIKGIFADTNFYFLILTFIVAAVHLLFDFLAFKNDISYWKNRETMVGLSTRAVIWRCVSTLIIFVYLMDEETSLLVLIPAGIGTLIEMWKVKKAFKVKVHWTGSKPSIEFGGTSDKEKETNQFDSQAMKYLSYVLYPLCLAGAVYSLLYLQYKSWYSWCINSLVNGVYAFGFLFMLPQLFVNYKLKSVAHLPWRAFMYKAFNTFIDDIFAFIITMPTAHRLACFRDDIVFLVYLYQRWLYPVDKKRVNEYGVSYGDEDLNEQSKANPSKSKKD